MAKEEPKKEETKKAEPIQLTEPSLTFDASMEKLLMKLIPAVALALREGEKSNKAMTEKELLAAQEVLIRGREKCFICGQARAGCGQKKVTVVTVHGTETVREEKEESPEVNHVRMSVYPRRESEAEWFQGVKINGVLYMSNGPGHTMWVPKACEGSIARIVQDFEENEMHLHRKRKGGRRLGSISPNSQNITVQDNDISGGWR